MRALTIAAVMMCVWLGPRVGQACDCQLLAPLDAAGIAEYDAVFEGTVRLAWRSAGARMRRFSVRRVWRGAIGSAVTISTDDWKMGCGYPFELGRSYIVFARRDRNGGLSVQCTHTTWLPRAGEMLAALGEGGVPQSGAGCDVGGPPEPGRGVALLLLLVGVAGRRRVRGRA